ncbi:uncharacterized protein PG986_008530 [Apiospora aurea]|uniref:Tail specific protease domain-containing protein n=1 Tax=Apiospora aurea TaxID=335848 RepID=A0ABR1QFY9_9PEZI
MKISFAIVAFAATGVAALDENNVKWSNSSLKSSCGRVSASYWQWKKSGGKGNFGHIPGAEALECLQSMPLYTESALDFLDAYDGYLQFQSTTKKLRKPPPSYPSLPTDLDGGLQKLRHRVSSGHYSNQFDFDRDLSLLLTRANDGHLLAGLCSQEVFAFTHDTPLMSVSPDGIELPRLYTVVEINGVDAVYYLESEIALYIGYQDPDARYNRLFPSPTGNFSKHFDSGAWTSRFGLWPGKPSYVVRFANGTELLVEVLAMWSETNGDMTYGNGRELFDVACRKRADPVLHSFPGEFITQPDWDVPPSGEPAFPRPDFKDGGGHFRGYTSAGPAMPDVAVLHLPTFPSAGGAREVAETVSRFLTQVVHLGKRGLVLDLSGNEGGDIVPAFNLFKTLFPNGNIYSATRFRSTELLGLMTRVFSAAWADGPDVLDPPLVYSQAVRPNTAEPFGSLKDFYLDPKVKGDGMSSLYAHFDFDRASTVRDPIRGFGGIPHNPKRQLFEAKDIAVMTDGRCASTCAILVDLLHQQGVRTLAFGGRPRPGPMQAVGGVRGGQRWSLKAIEKHVQTALRLAPDVLPPADVQRLAALAPPLRAEFPLQFDRYGQSGVNFRDAYGPEDDETPLQFVYEAADCRRFFTVENAMEPASMWVDAARAMFGEEGDLCVSGSRRA